MVTIAPAPRQTPFGQALLSRVFPSEEERQAREQAGLTGQLTQARITAALAQPGLEQERITEQTRQFGLGQALRERQFKAGLEESEADRKFRERELANRIAQQGERTLQNQRQFELDAFAKGLVPVSDDPNIPVDAENRLDRDIEEFRARKITPAELVKRFMEGQERTRRAIQESKSTGERKRIRIGKTLFEFRPEAPEEKTIDEQIFSALADPTGKELEALGLTEPEAKERLRFAPQADKAMTVRAEILNTVGGVEALVSATAQGQVLAPFRTIDQQSQFLTGVSAGSAGRINIAAIRELRFMEEFEVPTLGAILRARVPFGVTPEEVRLQRERGIRGRAAVRGGLLEEAGIPQVGAPTEPQVSGLAEAIIAPRPGELRGIFERGVDSVLGRILGADQPEEDRALAEAVAREGVGAIVPSPLSGRLPSNLTPEQRTRAEELIAQGFLVTVNEQGDLVATRQ